MATFKITKTTTVAKLKKQFRDEFGGTLRIYDGRSEAPDTATLVSLGGKVGELECRASRTVGKFIEAFQSELGLKVKVYTPDNWVAVLDGITLATVKEIPNGSTKAKMEAFLAYQRDEKEEDSTQNCPTDWNDDTVAEVYKYMSVDELADFLDSSCVKSEKCNADTFSYFTGDNLAIACKKTEGYCFCTFCSKDDSQAQWNTAGKEEHGVCVKIAVNFSGWIKDDVYYSNLILVDNAIGDDISAKDILTAKPKSEHGKLAETIFFKKANGNDSIPYKIQGIILGKNMSEEERQKCNAIIQRHKDIKTEPLVETNDGTTNTVEEKVAPLPNPNAIYFVITTDPRPVEDYDNDDESYYDGFIAFRAVVNCQYLYGVWRSPVEDLAAKLGIDIDDIEVFDMGYEYDSVENYPSGKNIYLPKWLYELYTSTDSNLPELCPDSDSEPINVAIDCCLTNYSSDWVFDKEVPCLIVKKNGNLETSWFASASKD